jgi:hypothetical protein
MVAFAQPCQPNNLTQDTDDVPAAMWRPLFRNVPALASISPDVRPMRDQIAHLARLMQRLPATAEESALIAQAYQLCERTHGYSAISAALEIVTRLLSDAVVAMHLSITAIAGTRGYPNAGAWAGALVEGRANIPPATRRFPAMESVVRAGSPNIEFEDVECGLDLAQALGVIQLKAMDIGDSQPFIVLAAAIRQHRDRHFRAEIQQCAVEAASQPDRVGAHIAEVDRIAQQYGFVLPNQWRWFAIRHNRAKARSQINRQRAIEE